MINLRLEHFYGPGASESNFISSMIVKMLKNDPNIDLTMGEQNRDFLYISDLLNVFDLIINNIDNLKFFQNFSVGSGNDINIKMILELIKKLTNSTSKLNYGAIPYRHNELMNSSNDLKNLTDLGWSPKIGIEEGIKNVIFYEKNKLKV